MTVTRRLAFVGLFVFVVPVVAQDFDQIEIETKHLSGSVHAVMSRAGGNMAACVGDDGVLLVDSDYEQLSAKVKAAVATLDTRPVRFLVNTHWHFDHVGGNAGYAAAGAVVVAHDDVRSRLMTDQHIAILEVDVPASPPLAWPAVTFADGITFHLNGETIVVRHIPSAHTDGDAVVRFDRANVVHTGDIVFAGGYPFIDVGAGGSIDGMIAAVETIHSLCDESTKIIPGHGPIIDRAELDTYGEMLRRFRDTVAAEIAAGKDLEAIQEAHPTASLDETWGNRAFSPEEFTEIVYRSLVKR